MTVPPTEDRASAHDLNTLMHNLYDQFCDCAANDFRDVAAAGLRTLLTSLNLPSGALLRLKRESRTLEVWAAHNLPANWLVNLQNPYSDGSIALVDQAFRNLPIQVDPPDLPGSTTIPLVINHAVEGIFLFSGQYSPKETAHLQSLLKPFAWAMLRDQTDPSAGIDPVFSQVLATISDIQENHNQIDEIQLRSIHAFRSLYRAEEAVLVLLDAEDPHLAIYKLAADDLHWKTQVSKRLAENPRLFFFENQHQDEFTALDPNFYQDLLDDNLGVEVRELIGFPLVIHKIIIGFVLILNPHIPPQPIIENLARVLIKVLSRAIQSYTHNRMLAISNAELEARCWEVINSRNTLRTFFDSIPSSVYIIDSSYTVVAINKIRCDKIATEPRQVVGKKCYKKLYDRNDPCPGCRVQETFRSAAITNRINREWLEQDRIVEWEIITYPIQNQMNHPHQVIIFEQDVTEKRSLEANLIQSEKLAAVGQLAAGVAHEINNPLTAIIANAQMLQREMPADNEDFSDMVRLIEIAGVRASQVVANLLSISRKESRYEFEAFSLNENILGALSLINHEMVSHSIKVSLNLSPDQPEIFASRNHLQGVWINLLVNAIDAVESGGEISISTRWANNQFTVTITDNGKGIPQQQLNRIFEPFYTTKIAGRGTGLGLSVCMRVIKEHRGNITVTSGLGKGTAFTVTLPDNSHLLSTD